jgi:hypothetical protein
MFGERFAGLLASVKRFRGESEQGQLVNVLDLEFSEYGVPPCLGFRPQMFRRFG